MLDARIEGSTRDEDRGRGTNAPGEGWENRSHMVIHDSGYGLDYVGFLPAIPLSQFGSTDILTVGRMLAVYLEILHKVYTQPGQGGRDLYQRLLIVTNVFVGGTRWKFGRFIFMNFSHLRSSLGP